MQYIISGGKFVLSGNKFLVTDTFPSVPQLTFKLSVIRNAEMNNIVGDAGSTNLTISARDITTGVLTVPNLPVYSGFTIEPSSWLIKDVDNNSTSIFCNIDDIAKTVTLNPSSGLADMDMFTIGHNISLFNPFINYGFAPDNQIPANSPIPTVAGTWRDNQTGCGALFKDPCTGVFKMLFYGYNVSTGDQVGLAVSNDMINWDVSNNGQPVITSAMVGASYVYTTGNIRMVDSSFSCMVSTSLGIRNAYFDKDASSVTFGPYLKGTGTAVGSIEKIGSDYYMLYMDVSSGVPYRNIKAAVSTTGLDGSYNDYQTIVYAAIAPAGTCWDLATDAPFIINDGTKIMGIFGAQGSSDPGVHAGVGVTNREFVGLLFDASTKLWSINPLGPVIINPIDWPVSVWCNDHIGGANSILIDGSNMWMVIAFNGSGHSYQTGVVKLKNFN